MEDDTNDAYDAGGTGDTGDMYQTRRPNDVNDPNRDWLTKEEAEIFIGKNSHYYLDKWSGHRESLFKGWNWAAFLFSVFWMSYRRMYAEVFLLLLIIVVAAVNLGVVLMVLGINDSGRTLSVILRLLTGMCASLVGSYGNALYRKKALRVFRKFSYLGNVEQCMALHSKGGVRAAGIIACLAMLAAFVAFLTILLYLHS